MKVHFLNSKNEFLVALEVDDAFVSINAFLKLPMEYAKFRATENLQVPLFEEKRFRIIDIDAQGATAIPE